MSLSEDIEQWYTDSLSPLEKEYRGDPFMRTVMTLPFNDIQRIMKDEQFRQRTFIHIWPNTTRLKFSAFRKFAKAGFYYTGDETTRFYYTSNRRTNLYPTT